MGLVDVISVFANRSVTKNASIVSATPIHLGNCGPDTVFWTDINASGGGNFAITYQVGDTPDETFYRPVGASIMNRFPSSIGVASRNRVDAEIMGTKWIKFKAKEMNASPGTINIDLIISKGR